MCEVVLKNSDLILMLFKFGIVQDRSELISKPLKDEICLKKNDRHQQIPKIRSNLPSFRWYHWPHRIKKNLSFQRYIYLFLSRSLFLCTYWSLITMFIKVWKLNKFSTWLARTRKYLHFFFTQKVWCRHGNDGDG